MTLLEQIRKLYSEHTGEEIAQAIKQYRQEMTLIQEELAVDQKLSELTEIKAKIKQKRGEIE